jgi:hypothetical protein
LALFKIFKGNSSTLPETYKDGYCYFTIDDGKMYIDTSNATDGSGRICLNAKMADIALTAEQANKLSSPYISTSSDLDGFCEANVFKAAAYTGVSVKGIDQHGILLSGGWKNDYFGF